jgi:hypothetical protein
MGSNATHTSGSLDGSMWAQPDAMCAMLQLAPTLLYLCLLVCAFFEGALETWVHFSAEFVKGGTISGITASENHGVWMETTNDGNEGALGGFHKAARDNGNMSLLYYNRKTMYKCNNTTKYMETLLPDDC